MRVSSATAHGKAVTGELLYAKGRMRFKGTEYGSPSGAGQAAAGWKSCNGWKFWRYRHPDTAERRVIDELRGTQ